MLYPIASCRSFLSSRTRWKCGQQLSKYVKYNHSNVPCLGALRASVLLVLYLPELLEVLYLLDVLCLLKVIYFRFPIGLTVSHRIPSSTVKNCCFLPLRVKNADLYLTVVNFWLSNLIIPFFLVQKFDVIRLHDITQLRVLIGSSGHFMPKRSWILPLDETIHIPSFLDELITSPDKFF